MLNGIGQCYDASSASSSLLATEKGGCFDKMTDYSMGIIFGATFIVADCSSLYLPLRHY